MTLYQISQDPVLAQLCHSAELCCRFDFSAFHSCWADTAAARQPVCRSVRVHFDGGSSTFSVFIGMIFGSSVASQLHGWWPDTAPLQLSLRAVVEADASCGFTLEVLRVARTDDDSSCDGLLRRECDNSLSWLLDAARRSVSEWVLLASAPEGAEGASQPNLFVWIAAHVAFALKHSVGRHSCVSSLPLAAFASIPCAIEPGVDVQQHNHEQAAIDSGSQGMCLCDALAGFQVEHKQHLLCGLLILISRYQFPSSYFALISASQPHSRCSTQASCSRSSVRSRP
jgi:hypothetical protein